MEQDDRPQVQRGSDQAPSSSVEAEGSGGTGEGRGTRGIRVLAFDAGNTSGFAYYEEGALVQGQLKTRDAAYDLLAAAEDLDALAYEQFVIRTPLKEEHASVVYINGAIESEARRRRLPCYRYTPSVSKRRISDDTLKNLGWWPGFGLRTGGHAADATRILVCTLTDHWPLELANYDR